MKIDYDDEHRLAIHVETFQNGGEVLKKQPLANFIVIIFSIALTIAITQPDIENLVDKVLIALVLGFFGVEILSLSAKLPSPERITKAKYIFDRETDTILAEPKTQEIDSNLSQIKNIQLIFGVETSDPDYESGIIERIDSKYSIEIDFENGKSLQLECNSCSLIKSDDDKSAFCNLVSDSDMAVKKLRTFLNLEAGGGEMS